MIEIYIETGPMVGQHFILTEDRPLLTFGRCEGGVQVDVDLASYGSVVSRRHAQLRLYGVQVAVADLGSRNGTAIEGEPVPAGQEVLVALGTRIHLAPPGGPSLIVRPPSRQWGDEDEELALLRKENRELRVTYEAIRGERDSLVSRLAEASPGSAAAPGMDWEGCQRRLTECRDYLEELRVLLSELNLDGKARGLLTKAQTRLGELTGQLRRGN